MSSTELQLLLQQAIESAKAGNKARARSLLIEVTEADPNSEIAWMWRASLSLTPKDAAWCLTKVLAINPANRQAQDWLDKIRLLQNQPPAITTRLAPPAPPAKARTTGAHRVTSPIPVTPPTVSDLSSFSPATNHSTSPSASSRAAATVPVNPNVNAPPAVQPSPPPPPKLTSAGAKEAVKVAPVPSPTAKVILAVDDSLTVRRSITQALESSGYRVITAADGYEALAKLKEVTPDLVVMDVALPGGMNGYQLCKHIRAEKSRRDIPVVMLSSRESFFDKVQSRLAGAVQHLTKPFKIEELVLSVRRHLKE
ncbi:MAG: response regulator [Chloracidobacterium sp.]|nr:response regulator [Chloracidobacterium sp.]MDW8216052.1 response regulator [Acidobacteriota bacterium]